MASVSFLFPSWLCSVPFNVPWCMIPSSVCLPPLHIFQFTISRLKFGGQNVKAVLHEWFGWSQVYWDFLTFLALRTVPLLMQPQRVLQQPCHTAYIESGS